MKIRVKKENGKTNAKVSASFRFMKSPFLLREHIE